MLKVESNGSVVLYKAMCCQL